MPFEAGSLAVRFTWDNEYRFFCDREHIRSEHCGHCPFTRSVADSAEPCIQVGMASFRQNAGVKLLLVALTFAKASPIGIPHVSVELVFACRGIAYCD
ncbi:hypothetical protein D3C75_1179150 [compost metagenome]